MNDENGKLGTSDFYFAAYCLAQGFKIEEINRDNPRRMIFVFGDIKHGDQLAEDFLYGRTSVEPKRFAQAIRELKQLLYS